MTLKLRCLFVKLGTTFLILFSLGLGMAAIGAAIGLASLPNYIALPIYFLFAWPLFTYADKTGDKKAKQLEARERENVLEKLARL